MTSKTAILAAAISSLFALTTTAFAADDSNSEKCYGVAKAGKNDCAGGRMPVRARAARTAVPRSSSNYRKVPVSASLVARSPRASRGELPWALASCS